MATDVSSGQYKLNGRASHQTQVIGDSLYLWGGLQPNLPEVHNNNEKRRLTSQVQIFNFTSGKWDTKHTRGNPPLGVARYFSTTWNNKIYFFGGWCGHDYCHHNSLNELDTSTLTWTQISPTDDRRPVMKRGFGNMILTEYGGVQRLLVIGGAGSPPSIKLTQAQYIQLPSGRIHTNEQNLYNMSKNKWTIPDISGQCMPPNNSFVMEMIHNTRAIIFGGRVNEGTPNNTIYIVDIINNTLHWQTITKPDLAVQWPKERENHAASIITGSMSPILVVTGGLDNYKNTLKDCWILDISKKSWTKINLPDSVTKRWAHSLSTYMMGPHSVWLVIVGGIVNFDDIYLTDSNITTLIEFVLNDDQWSVGFVLDSNALTVLQQFTELKRKWREQQTKSSQDNLSTKETILQPNYQYDLLVAQQNIQSLQERLLELESQQDRQQGELQEVKSERDQYQQSNLRLLQQLQRTEQDKQDIVQQSQEYRQQLEDCQGTVCILRQQLEQLHSLQGQPHWVVGREEVTITQEVLGGGSYGEVKVAMFRGLRVAAKSLHGIIISDYTRDLFSREMDIASRVRHPNLVQFIGATRVGTPIILTEIMTTSLYKELQKKALTQPQILGISQDVASALNYLHLWKPNPIIHRDVSSPNVLLEPSVGDSFKAKVADYGAANLQQQAKTDMPGNPAYAAPESRYPDDHTPAMDVYSYSVLLMEMILHCPPAMTVIEREQQASRVSWSTMSSLIQRCINRDHRHRPTMIQILNQLKLLKV